MKLLKILSIYFCIVVFDFANPKMGRAEKPVLNEGGARPFSFSNNFDTSPPGNEIYYPISAPFCQIFSYRLNLLKMRAELTKFSTFKLGPCTDQNFAKISIASANAQLKTIAHSTEAYKNGPSYFTMDANLSPLKKQYIFIGPLKFSEQSITHVSIFRFIFDSKISKKGIALAYFTPFTAHEDIYFIWNAGSTVYELIPADGKGSYVMTSYSTMIDMELTKEKIPAAVGTLSLPNGWQFRQRILTKPLIVRTNLANDFRHKVIFDQLQNFYHYVE